ncbi:MAG TPA: SGNH/GDSL hydrolase family protein [Hanamia sp.]|nr:SGNH/GDSL hydrolase family protein [Hanamia sp.]
MKRIKLLLCMGLFLSLIVPSLKAQKDSMKNELNETNDWPNLRRYRSENAQLKPEKNRVVFMGNSITDAWLNVSPDFFKTHPSYIDRGISGQTTPQMLIRFRQDVIDLHPKVVLILAGINDIAGNTGPSSLDMIENNLASMAQLGKANGIKVILCSVLPAYDIPWRAGIDPVQKIIDLNKWIKEFAHKNNFIYLDYYSAMVDERKGLPAKYSKDGVHPTAEGYAVMEPMAVKAIRLAIGKK